MPEEIWKDIPGYEGRYQASTAGRIRSLDRELIGRNHYTGKPFVRTMHGRVLRPGPSRTGHLSVVLGHGAHGSQVHQLVALTFIGPCPEGKEVLHNDGDPKNNSIDNLRYGTRTENILDVYRIGRAWRHLTEAQAREIKSRLREGEKAAHIARTMGVRASSVYSIKQGRSFGWLIV